MNLTAVNNQFTIVAAMTTDMVGHMHTIKSYAAQVESAVEFGVHDCTSTWALMAGHPKKLTSYDVIRQPDVDLVEQLAVDSGTEFKFVLENSLNAQLEDADLLFIDSFHAYEQLKAELRLHAAKIRKFILMHDTSIFEFMDQTYSGRGLWPAIAEFLAEHPEWKIKERFTHCHGLTVLERIPA